MKTKQYKSDREILKEAFDDMMKSEEKVYLMKYDEKSLGYGPIKRLGECSVILNEVKDEDLWEFVYDFVTTEINPKPEITFPNMRFGHNEYKNANIMVNEKIEILVSNMYHQYDQWVEQLEENYHAKIKKKTMQTTDKK